MALPKQVAAAEARSTELMAQAQAAATATPEAVPAATVAPDVVVPAAPVTPAVVAAPEASREDWKAKYHTLKGKYDAEVPRLHESLRERDQRITALEAKLVAVPTPAVVEDAPDPDATTFGPELVAMIKRRVADAKTETEARVRAEFAEANAATVAKVEKVEARTARDVFLSDLTAKVADWTVIDETPEWREYLAGKDRLARKTRQELITEAFKDGDVDAVADYFNSYKESKTPAVVVPPAPVEEEPERTLAHLVTPTPSGRATVAQDTKIWTSKEVTEFYKNVALNKIRGSEAADGERDIALASKEGRVR